MVGWKALEYWNKQFFMVEKNNRSEKLDEKYEIKIL